jgi:carboxypeptidase PM20D1
VRIPTVSFFDETLIDWDSFERFIATIAELYPRVHGALEVERIGGHSLLMRWPGRKALEPASDMATVLMAHYDVVPASDEGWEHPPFAADVTGELNGDGTDNRVIWGRGTLDNKAALTAILEAVESRLDEGFAPEHDIYLSFGHNEETTGGGARAIVQTLANRRTRPTLVIDEGGAVVEGVFPGVTEPIAVVGVSEKGITSLVLTVEQHGGHASTPPRLTATARLARAIVRLNNAPFPATFSATDLEMISTVGAHANRPLRWVFTNLWLTRPLILRLFSRLSDETRAIARTTQAVTMLDASRGANVLAERAVATVNIRIAVGSSVQAAIDHVRRAIRDEHVVIDALHPAQPSPVSPTTGEAWLLLQYAIGQTYPGAIVTPYVMLAASDSRHFTTISEHVYRFSPFRMSAEERATLHAKNERMTVATFVQGVQFYRAVIARV